MTWVGWIAMMVVWAGMLIWVAYLYGKIEDGRDHHKRLHKLNEDRLHEIMGLQHEPRDRNDQRDRADRAISLLKRTLPFEGSGVKTLTSDTYPLEDWEVVVVDDKKAWVRPIASSNPKTEVLR